MAKKSAKSVMPSGVSAKNVGDLHKELLKLFARHLIVSPKLTIAQPDLKIGLDVDWSSSSTGARLEFELRDAQLREVGFRGRGGRAQVFRFQKNTAWASWYEKWTSLGEKQFRLEGLGLTIWAGEEFTENKVQLLRAEWDWMDDPAAIQAAAQPHWHLDTHVALPIFRRDEDSSTPATEEPTELERLADDLEGLERIEPEEMEVKPPSISTYHLGMSGRWQLAGSPSWRTPWEHDLSDIAHWLHLCLDYLSEELGRNARQ